jgi:hypothetical protein
MGRDKLSTNFNDLDEIQSDPFPRLPAFLAMVFLVIRGITLGSMPFEGLVVYGDFLHFFHLAELGMPFIDIWVEFPPLFPFLSRLIEILSSGRFHTYSYILLIVISVSQAGAVYLVALIARRQFDFEAALKVGILYLGYSVAIPYGWWFFDSFVVVTLLIAIEAINSRKPILAGLSIAIGTLIKWFPALQLADIIRRRDRRETILVLLTTVLVVGTVWLLIFVRSPSMTTASLQSQSSKGSWETIWALLDGNWSTGNFGPEIERYDVSKATLPRGNPPIIPPVIPLIVFVVVGLFVLYRSTDRTLRTSIAFTGFTFCLFFIWSPGWSPQWILYLLPLILLGMHWERALLFSLTFVVVSILEWPILLSRGLFELLWIPVLIRTALLVLLAIVFARISLERSLVGEEYG